MHILKDNCYKACFKIYKTLEITYREKKLLKNSLNQNLQHKIQRHQLKQW